MKIIIVKIRHLKIHKNKTKIPDESYRKIIGERYYIGEKLFCAMFFDSSAALEP